MLDVWNVDTFGLDPDLVHSFITRTDREEHWRGELLHPSFLVVRGALRRILSEYLSRESAEQPIRRCCRICGTIGDHGKPYLDTGGLHFSIAYGAESVALVAVSDRPVGVDVERVQPITFADINVALHRRELDAIRQATRSPEDDSRLILQTWVMKESYVKATGRGLSADPSEVPIMDQLINARDVVKHDDFTISAIFHDEPDLVAGVASPTTNAPTVPVELRFIP